MSIGSALANAMTGLTASARSAEVVSSNIANAMTEGYARRSLSVSAMQSGNSGGVKIDGIQRHSNPVLLAERRLADADYGQAATTNQFYSRLETLVGTPDQPDSLSGMLAEFETALVTATGGPESDVRLRTVADQGAALANSLAESSRSVQDMRSEADANIGVMVDRLNSLLTQTKEMNERISLAVNQGQDPSSLMDQRQQMVDEIGEMVPLRVADRDRGAVALYTTKGTALLDGMAFEVEFTPTPTVEPHMTQANGMLSGLTVNGNPVRTDSAKGALSGGSLGAQFEIRDELAVSAQEQLDAAARDLVERFQDRAVDPTLAPGDAGLFTDMGAAFDPANEVGLAGRLELNALVSTDGLGETWRLRDGLGAAAPGDSGDASQLLRYVDTLQTTRLPASGSFGAKTLNASGLFGALHSDFSTQRVNSDTNLAFASSRIAGLETLEAAEGVDTDNEMQQLMLIEQSYAANARMISVIDELMTTLLRM